MARVATKAEITDVVKRMLMVERVVAESRL